MNLLWRLLIHELFNGHVILRAWWCVLLCRVLVCFGRKKHKEYTLLFLQYDFAYTNKLRFFDFFFRTDKVAGLVCHSVRNPNFDTSICRFFFRTDKPLDKGQSREHWVQSQCSMMIWPRKHCPQGITERKP